MEGADPRGRLSRLGTHGDLSEQVGVPAGAASPPKGRVVRRLGGRGLSLSTSTPQWELDAAQSARDAAAEDTARERARADEAEAWLRELHISSGAWQRRVATTSDCVAELKE
ncbi:hypothetical protein PAHAL_4G205500 [Panicum hallii]|uniref:Uncharacterized protein n=1 Tax=Panicum hallii TaxID=206008 RepID=A0A2S3HJB2_9POAL|nr:hypothetical protein PAHAL_4G205500 [Panicum hallii]